MGTSIMMIKILNDLITHPVDSLSDDDLDIKSKTGKLY